MFCQFYAHEVPQEVSKDTCSHFQCVFVPWTCEFVQVLRRSQSKLLGTFNVFLCLGHVNLSHRKSSPTNTCQEKSFLCLMFGSPKMFCKFHDHKVLRRSQRTLVGTFNVFLSLGHVNLSHRKSSPTKTCQEKSSLPHDWISKDVCKFHAHKGPQEVSKDTCGHFHCVSVPWTCEFVPQKKFSNQHLSGKKFSV